MKLSIKSYINWIKKIFLFIIVLVLLIYIFDVSNKSGILNIEQKKIQLK